MARIANLTLSFCITASILLCSVFSQAQPTKQTFLWQGQEREYYAYVPATYNNDSDILPVMVFLHGFDGGIDSYNNSIDFQQAADQFHWLILLPQALSAHAQVLGMNIPVGSAWNSGIVMTVMGNSFTPNSNVDDAGFLLALVDSLGLAYSLDPDSLFFTGFSMGAFMTHRMAIEHADRINGVAAASGLIPLCFADSTPSSHINVLHIHGTEDNMIHLDGTASPIPGMGQMTLGLSVDSTIAYWRRVNQCNLAAIANTYADTEDDGMLFTLYTYGSNADDTRVALLSMEGGKHKWYEEGYDVQYLTAIHDFFTGSQSYSFTGINDYFQRNQLTFYPNPARDTIIVESPCKTQLFIYNANGRIISSKPLVEGCNVIDVSLCPAGVYLLSTAVGQSATLIVR
ncbi:MAG: T9SS type A sorting domain-containing protein [Bacteroidales bacterium]|nr:T9SS type A sorting domain-containing protein [Bacteroidales bacterium]